MNDLLNYLQIIGFCFALIFPIANPLTPVVLMISLGSRLSEESRNFVARRAAVYSLVIMIVSFYFGQFVMHFFGISIPGLRIAGGLIVTYIGFQMLFHEDTRTSAPELESKQEELKHKSVTNIAFIPITMPGFAGPGAIALIISIAATLPNTIKAPIWMLMTAPLVSFILLCITLWFCLKSSHLIMKKLGKSGIDVISRLMGFLLVCMGVQFGINGILEIVTSIGTTSAL